MVVKFSLLFLFMLEYTPIYTKGFKMQLYIDVNSLKSNVLIEILKTFKKIDMINDFKFVDKANSYDDEVLKDIQMLSNTIKDAKKCIGYDTSKTVNIKDM